MITRRALVTSLLLAAAGCFNSRPRRPPGLPKPKKQYADNGAHSVVVFRGWLTSAEANSLLDYAYDENNGIFSVFVADSSYIETENGLEHRWVAYSHPQNADKFNWAPVIRNRKQNGSESAIV